MGNIVIKGAREHNLKNIDLSLPRDRFIVISGMSGSGKSSLAFDTIFAEGQRRYVESLSAYARQFLGRMDKPDVDYIEGLSPAISIEQKTTNRNPRSTVGTVTEIYDYLRLLFARIGIPHDPKSGKRIEKQSVDQIIDAILAYPEGTRMVVHAPIVRGRKGTHTKVLDDARGAGFQRARIDGTLRTLDDDIVLDKKFKHSIDIVIDRLRITPASRKRAAEAVELALETSNGLVITEIIDGKKTHERSYSRHYAYTDSDLVFPELEPRLFSFNSPYGACPACTGLGMTMEFDVNLIMPDRSLSFNQNGIVPYNSKSSWNNTRFRTLADHLKFSLDTPLAKLSKSIIKQLLHGVERPLKFRYVNREENGHFEYFTRFPGILADLKRRYSETTSDGVKEWLEGFMTQRSCPDCGGRRLRPEALAVTIQGHSIYDLTSLSVGEALRFFDSLELSAVERKIVAEIHKEICARLGFMQGVGLDYLSLDRGSATLSGGEAQRIRLATQIGSSLVGVLYILDEPTIGLHQRDNERLIRTLMHLRDIGNTLIVVEHDEQTLRSADWIVELGPAAGVHGGNVVAQGNVQEIQGTPHSLTGQYLNGTLRIEVPSSRRSGSGKKLRISAACEHNLKNIDVELPLGTLSLITGVSGSGKSSLLSDVVYPAISNRVGATHLREGAYSGIEGTGHIDKVISVDQSPIGRTPRSNPATYVGLFTPIRDLFSNLPGSRERGFKAGRFSFNVPGGRCEHCQGAGTIKIEMHFLSDVYVVCDICKGRRFNRETLEIRYKGKNIYDVLQLSVEEAVEFFANVPAIARRLETLERVGLGYIRLGQSAVTLSGGEAQRVKLSLELSRRGTGHIFYILDEPTTGLHIADVKMLMNVIAELVDRGHTVAIIEHNLDVIMQADYVIDLGPEGGDGGGRIVVSGTPEEIAACSESHTGHFIRRYLNGAL